MILLLFQKAQRAKKCLITHKISNFVQKMLTTIMQIVDVAIRAMLLICNMYLVQEDCSNIWNSKIFTSLIHLNGQGSYFFILTFLNEVINNL